MRPLILTAAAVTFLLTISAFQQSSFDLKASISRGREIYLSQCLTCHMEKGEGIEGVYPPLAKSDYLMANKKQSINQVLEGAVGEITVNGVKYNGMMTAFALSDKEVSDVLNYVRNSWENTGAPVLPEEVKAARK